MKEEGRREWEGEGRDMEVNNEVAVAARTVYSGFFPIACTERFEMSFITVITWTLDRFHICIFYVHMTQYWILQFFRNFIGFEIKYVRVLSYLVYLM